MKDVVVFKLELFCKENVFELCCERFIHHFLYFAMFDNSAQPKFWYKLDRNMQFAVIRLWLCMLEMSPSVSAL